MMVKHLSGRLTVVALAAFIAAPAMASDSGFYVGANAGTTTFEKESDLDQSFDITTSSGQDAADTAWSLSLGYRFLPYVAVEASYVDFGSTTLYATGRDIPLLNPSRVDAQASVKGETLAVIGCLPLGKFELNGKVGVLFAKTDVSSQLTTGATQVAFSNSARTNNEMVGLGAGYTFADHYHIKLDVARYSNVGDEQDTGKRDITTVMVGFAYRF